MCPLDRAGARAFSLGLHGQRLLRRGIAPFAFAGPDRSREAAAIRERSREIGMNRNRSAPAKQVEGAVKGMVGTVAGNADSWNGRVRDAARGARDTLRDAGKR
jgi:hypothetical protein